MKRPRIGINALFRGKPSGVANYIINLVKQLARLDRENEYYIFVTETNRRYFDLKQDNFHEVICTVNTENPLFRRLWEQTMFPKMVKDLGLDLLHCPVNIVPFSIKCKSVVTLLDCQYFQESSRNTFLRKQFHKIFMKLSLNKAEALITISNSMKEEITHYIGENGKNIFVTHLGQDYDRNAGRIEKTETVRQKFGLERKYLMFVGFPQFRKNLPGLLKGFAKALCRLTDPYDLVFCGDFDTTIESDYPNMLKVIAEQGLESRVKFINYPENDDLQFLLTGAELLAFPSFYEGFGLPVIEAMACGTPVLVSDIPVMHEIAGEAGGYINPYDINDIADGIYRLISDKDLRQRLSEEGKKMASRFTWGNTAEKTLECYRSVTN
ncbi:MAG: hypothetical protein AMK70_00570 [Nitrospira bacterium SG8_35_1]|nr:MAG: hypothetical protein AMK70_00570 [Nitrospira bacterium SG8_35_1]